MCVWFFTSNDSAVALSAALGALDLGHCRSAFVRDGRPLAVDDVKALTADELVNVFGMERVEADLLASALLLEDQPPCGDLVLKACRPTPLQERASSCWRSSSNSSCSGDFFSVS